MSRKNVMILWLWVFRITIGILRFKEKKLIKNIKIYDGPSSISPFLMKPTCELARDIELPYTINSSLHMIEVYFESDHSESFNGFELEYRATTGYSIKVS